MVRRRTKTKRRRVQQAISQGDEVPDPTTAIVLSSIALAGTGVSTAALANRKPKFSQAPIKSPLAGESTQLKPGEKVNAINTSPQGVLTPASTGRASLLGG